MTKEPWHTMLLDALASLSNLDLQRRRWVERIGRRSGAELYDPPDPDELLCQIFDDTGLDDLLSQGAVFSNSTDQLLRRMSQLASTINTNQPRDQLIKDVGWIELTRLADQAYQSIVQDLEE